MDVFAAAIWYAVTASVVGAAWSIARCAFPADRPSERTMHAIVLIWTWIVLVSCSLGAFGVLSAVNLGLGALGLALGTSFWVRRRIAAPPSDGPGDSDRGTLRWHNLGWNILWTATVALAVALVGLRGVMQFPNDWDTLAYHRPLIDHWLQDGSLYVPACAVWFVPGNNELMGLWWAAAFSGDFWVGLMSLPAVLLLAVATYELGRLLGLASFLRHMTVIAVVGSSIVFTQVTNAKNDVAVGALCAAGFVYSIRFAQTRNWTDLALGSAALGILAGVKYYALGYAAVGWIGLVALAQCQHEWRLALRAALAAGGIMLLTGGYWYARNLAVTGTPIYPVGYSGPRFEEAAVPRSAWQSSILGNGRPEVLPQYVDAVWNRGGICQTAAVLALPTSWLWMLGTGLASWNSRRFSSTAALRAVLAAVVAGAWLNFLATPFTVDPDNDLLLKGWYILTRFSQVPLILSVVVLSLQISDVSRWISAKETHIRIRSALSALLPAIFAAAAVLTFFTSAADALGDQWPAALLIALDLVVLYIVARGVGAAISDHAGRSRRIAVRALFVSGMLLFVLSTARLSLWWHANFVAHYNEHYRTRAFSTLKTWEGAPPSVVAVHYLYYPFFGSARQCRAARPPKVYSKDFLLTYLASQESDFVAVIHRDPFPLGRYHQVSQWTEEHPELFDEVDSGSGFRLYRVDKTQLRDHLGRGVSPLASLSASE